MFMKKFFVAAALVMELGISATFANEMVTEVETATMVNEYKPIDKQIFLSILILFLTCKSILPQSI